MRPPQAMPAETVVGGAPRPVGRPDQGPIGTASGIPGAPGMPPAAPGMPPGAPGAPAGQARPAAAPPRPQPAAIHHAVLCVNAPAMAASGPDGQLRGHGLHGFYRSGVRVLARMELRLGGVEPLPLQGALTTAAQARFMGAVRVPGDLDPDPALTVERLRHADGVETVTVRNSGSRPARLPLEMALGTDLGPVGEIAAGHRPPDLPGQVQSAGLRWAGPGHSATVSAKPSPHAVLAGAGVLRWDLEIQPGARWSVELRIELETTAPGPRPPGGRGPGVPLPWAEPEVRSDDARAELLVTRSLDALGGLLFADPDRPTDLYAASGAPWRFGLAPADALWAARLTLPLGTRLAVGTLRALARRQQQPPGPGQGAAGQGAPGRRPDGLLPGALRHGGPELPPTCTATEATLLFVTVLAEAWRWGLPRHEVAELLPTAERALEALRGGLVDGFVTDLSRPVEDRAAHPVPARAEVQSQAHRAALHGAELLAEFGRPGAGEWRDWAADLRDRFRERFWVDDLSGGRPAAALAPGGQPLPAVASSLVHLLDTGLSAEGGRHESLLDREQTRLLAQRLAAPELDSGWGLRTLSAKSVRFNPLGHRSGAVRIHETALAIAGLAESGHENEAGALLEGLLSAAAHFEGRFPEMYAGEQRSTGCPPVPHPAACRPAALSAAGAVHAVFALAGVRPDVPGGRVLVRPASTAPLGELQLTGLRVAGEPFSVRVSRIGVAMVEEAPPQLQLVAR
ncbi:glycogen debranching N-terminal domain-containing protein [Kitasatospora sp. NPDC054939]